MIADPVTAETTDGVATADGDVSPAPAPGPPSILGEWADVDVSDLSGFADAIERIYAGDLDGMTIRNVIDPAELTRALEILEGRHHADFKDHGEQTLYGTALVGADDDRANYFADAPLINGRLHALFERSFTDRIEGVLSAVGGGRSTEVPSEGPGRDYVPATVRFLQPGRGVMHAHTANEFCNAWPAHSHLRDVARMWNSLSYFVVAEAPGAGGELVVYDLQWDDTPGDVRSLPMSEERDELLERFEQRLVTPGAGDMILFTGGRIWHRVAPVRGDRRRVTIGGFVALSNDDDRILYWS